ncbi:MAG: cation-transporting P-type ATPase [Anaerolineaceae bacterium]
MHGPTELLTSEQTAWHALQPNEVAVMLETSEHGGLTSAEAKRRLLARGPNALPHDNGRPWWRTLADQFTQFLVIVLVGAAVVSSALGEFIDAGVILAIIALNGLLGFAQEHRAEQALNALKSLAPPMATAVRDSLGEVIPAERLVPGDLVRLQAGDIVPADGRLVELAGLHIDESILTGESVPVEKLLTAVDSDAALSDRLSMVYQGGRVVRGRAAALITGTGVATELGQIALSLSRKPRATTPLQGRLSDTGRWLVYGAGALCALVFVVGLLRGIGLHIMFLTSISLAVAAIPEGLPAATTVVLALGVQRMAGRKAVVRRLSAVEALGSVTAICTDKTGTLTENRMRVRELWTVDGPVAVTGPSEGLREPTVAAAIRAAALCNDASPAEGATPASGDPTETALLDLAQDAGLDPAEIRTSSPRVAEVPFDAERARMTVVCEKGGGGSAYSKGAPEVILHSCARYAAPGGERPMPAELRAQVLAAASEMAARGVRVLAVGAREFSGPLPLEAAETDLTFLALIGLSDPLRTNAASSIGQTRAAGIRVLMLTGDHPESARAIAGELRLPTDRVALGRELDGLDDSGVDRILAGTNVFARVSSAHKPRIVDALRREGHIVAMTGDGVNDAPALQLADIGVAMTGSGTDVARDAADIVLLDNNYGTIVAAIEEGRAIYDNIRKFVHYLLTCNSAEVAVVFLILVFGGVTPLLPAQILFINLVTDGLPALALGREPAEPGIMSRPPRPAQASILTRESVVPLVGIGGLVAASTIAAYVWGQRAGGEEVGQQLAFATLVGTQIAASFAFRSPTESVLRLRPNFWLIGAAFASIALLVAATLVPFLQTVFRTEGLSAARWLGVAALSMVPLVVVEALKLSGIAARIAGWQSMPWSK